MICSNAPVRRSSTLSRKSRFSRYPPAFRFEASSSDRPVVDDRWDCQSICDCPSALALVHWLDGVMARLGARRVVMRGYVMYACPVLRPTALRCWRRAVSPIPICCYLWFPRTWSGACDTICRAGPKHTHTPSLACPAGQAPLECCRSTGDSKPFTMPTGLLRTMSSQCRYMLDCVSLLRTKGRTHLFQRRHLFPLVQRRRHGFERLTRFSFRRGTVGRY